MKKNTRSKAFTRQRFWGAFTMVELLTVVAIIAILAGLLFPTIKTAMLKAEKAKAQTAIAGLSTAFRSYYNEYGRWPVADTAANSNQTYVVDTNLVVLLKGVSNTGTLSGLTDPPPVPPTPTYSGTANLQGNARGIGFLEFKAEDLDVYGAFVDPWRQPYKCRFDQSYTNYVRNPFTGGSVAAQEVNTGFLVWSSGPDGRYDNNGDVPPSALNKDNTKSW
jgi:prepilin-type N-terminal cleavage/methylation domain-containing protein